MTTAPVAEVMGQGTLQPCWKLPEGNLLAMLEAVGAQRARGALRRHVIKTKQPGMNAARSSCSCILAAAAYFNVHPNTTNTACYVIALTYCPGKATTRCCSLAFSIEKSFIEGLSSPVFPKPPVDGSYQQTKDAGEEDAHTIVLGIPTAPPDTTDSQEVEL